MSSIDQIIIFNRMICTEWMPEALRVPTVAVAVAPTKSEATPKALSGMRRESPE